MVLWRIFFKKLPIQSNPIQFASGFPDRPISAIETIRRIGEKFEKLMEDTFSFVL
jgi:hypothetical protein